MFFCLKNRVYYLLLLLFVGGATGAEKKILYLQPLKNVEFALKYEFLRDLALITQAKNFIETGTYCGDSTEVAASIFENVYTVELSKDLFLQAKRRLKKFNNISFYLGDSKSVLPSFLDDITGKTIFFLDGHYSGGSTAKAESDTPIIGELVAIKNSKLEKPIIIIDDIRFFTCHRISDYPSLAYIEEIVHEIDPCYQVYIIGDMALVFHKDEPFDVSPLIKACTISRMSGERCDLDEELQNKIQQAEMVIAQANGSEKMALLELHRFYERHKMEKIGAHYRLWAGVIEFGNNNYQKARKHFYTALRLGLPNERITPYLEQMSQKSAAN